MKFPLRVCLKFQILGAYFCESLTQYLDSGYEKAFLTQTLKDSEAGGTQITD